MNHNFQLDGDQLQVSSFSSFLFPNDNKHLSHKKTPDIKPHTLPSNVIIFSSDVLYIAFHTCNMSNVFKLEIK
ncbi:hypothetical protein DERP_012102 [Dermatophagoides pteronyssinus]|uniref:Uncharacterized protein n=1 Tax=Dermatophagoides pteronyssinus TaxID=6956 RepID=A0ABQ8ITY7_DERPT|nr:hypothetical protein DERP_012102 [Dermatophagoides pteronyssinus]